MQTLKVLLKSNAELLLFTILNVLIMYNLKNIVFSKLPSMLLSSKEKAFDSHVHITMSYI